MYQLKPWCNQIWHPHNGTYYIKETYDNFYMVSKRGYSGLWKITKRNVKTDLPYEGK